MTTFIDFRYSQTLAAAMFAGRDREEVELTLSPVTDNYLAFDARGAQSAHPLVRFASTAGALVADVIREADGAITVRSANGEPLVRAPVQGAKTASPIFALRLGPGVVGISVDGRKHEAPVALSPASGFARIVGDDAAGGARLMGRGSGRAMRWAKLFYHRAPPSGLQVDLWMDWHHLRAGIPWFGTMTAERWVEQGAFRLGLRSYAYEPGEARDTDFARLFGTDGPADIAVHLTPPLYANASPALPSVGFFVVESRDVPADLVGRCNRMDAICVPSRFAGDACRRAGVTRPIHVVPHGVDVDFFRPVAERRPLPGGRRFNFLAVCTHVERKNARHLVRAFLEEFRANEDVALFLLLRPEYHASQNNVALDFTEWERRHDRDSAPVLLWTDYVSRERLRDLYANANAYVMPSNEGFGLTLLEAMACGTPVIALDHGGVVDFVHRGNGLLVPPGREYLARDIDTLPYVGERFRAPDVRRLRAAMRQVVEHEDEALRRAAVARRECEERYGWDRVSRELARVVEATHRESQAPPRRRAAARATVAVPAISWVLAVVDDERCARSLRYLAGKASGGARVLCLFTRYARLGDVVDARERGFVAYRWDATLENCRLVAASVLGPGWIGVLSPGDRVEGDEPGLASFLAAQPLSVGEVAVECDGRDAPRFFRIGGAAGSTARAASSQVRIVGTQAGEGRQS